MNRLHHLKQTLPSNIKNNAHYKNIEFVLLDYNSKDGLAEYVQSELSMMIEQGLLVYYQNFQHEYFKRSHSRNMAFKLATGDIVCNIDADNYTGSAFAHYIERMFRRKGNINLNALHTGKQNADSSGRICIHKNDFTSIGGYDETFTNYGFEDYDIVSRLEMRGAVSVFIKNPRFLEAISHSDTERIDNEDLYHTTFTVLIGYLNPTMSHLLILEKGGTYRAATIIDNHARYYSKIESLFKDTFEGYKYEIVEEQWTTGNWHVNEDDIKLSSFSSDNDVLRLNRSAGFYVSETDGTAFCAVQDHKMIEEAIMFYSQISNRKKMEFNRKNQIIKANDRGYGNGVVFKNFSEIPIKI